MYLHGCGWRCIIFGADPFWGFHLTSLKRRQTFNMMPDLVAIKHVFPSGSSQVPGCHQRSSPREVLDSANPWPKFFGPLQAPSREPKRPPAMSHHLDGCVVGQTYFWIKCGNSLIIQEQLRHDPWANGIVYITDRQRF